MKKLAFLLFVLVMALSLAACGKGGEYKDAMSLYESGQYHDAAVKFTELSDYENSKEMVKTCKYEEAKELFKAGSYDEAREIFVDLADYEQSSDYVTQCDGAIAREKYGDVFDALAGNTWFYNGGNDTTLNRISFENDSASIAQVYFDGNGKHDNGSSECSYTVDDTNVIVSMSDGSELKIAYNLSEGKISLGDNEYYTLEEIDSGLQGYWKVKSSMILNGRQSKNEYNIFFDNGKVVSESAALANNPYYPDGYYNYFGPYEGTYKLNFGGFDTEIMHGGDWFFNIIGGKVTVLYYDHVGTPSDGLPGQNGYSF